MEPLRYDRHHLLAPRRRFVHLGGMALLARQHPVLIRKIPRVDHELLHFETPMVGGITQELAGQTLNTLGQTSHLEDKEERFDDLLAYYRHIKRGVGSLAIEAGNLHENLQEQRTYLTRSID